MKNFDQLTITDDFVFTSVLRRNKDLCRQLIERILNIKVRDIVYLETQEVFDFAREQKSIRLDVYVEDTANTVYDIELQAYIDKDLPKRSRYYQGMMDLGMVEKGYSYNALKKSYVIFLCTYDPFGSGNCIYHFPRRCTEIPELLLGDDSEIVVVNTTGRRDGVSSELKNLLEYIATNSIQDTFTKDLDCEVRNVVTDKEWRVNYMTLEMRDWMNQEKGREKGREEGRKEMEQESARFRALISALLKAGLTEEALKASSDQMYAQSLYESYNL